MADTMKINKWKKATLPMTFDDYMREIPFEVFDVIVFDRKVFMESIRGVSKTNTMELREDLLGNRITGIFINPIFSEVVIMLNGGL